MLDTSYDGQFDEIESPRWRPWVGRGYHNAPRKLLIVGESCYAQDEKGNPSPETEADFLQNRDTTRGVLNCNLEKEDTWKVYTGLCNTLVGGNEIEDRRKLWERVAYYYYLIQNRVMQTLNDTPQVRMASPTSSSLP